MLKEAKDRQREISRQYLEGEIGEVSFTQELLRTLYVSQSPELVKWLAEQILIAR